MKEYPMENSHGFWQWCEGGKKLVRRSKVQPMADGFSSAAKIGSLADGSSPNIISKGKQRIDNSPLHISSATFDGNPLKSIADCRDLRSPVQNSIAEVGPSENGISTKSPQSIIRHNASSSRIRLDTMSDHPPGDSGPDGQCLGRPLGIEEANSVGVPAFHEKQRPLDSRVGRRGQKPALKRNWLFSDQGMKGSSGQHAACNREPSVETSSSCSISKVVAEDMELHSPNMNGEITDLNYINWPCRPPARKRPKRNQSLVSETNTSPFEIENQQAKSGLHLLSDLAVQLRRQNDVAGFPENSLAEKEGFRKAIFIPTGVPFLQKRVLRRAKSSLKHHQPYARQMQSLSTANSKPLLTADNIGKLGDSACKKKSENKVVGNGVNEDPMAIPHVRRSKRTRSQALPSKYCGCVLQPSKKGTRR